MNEYENLIEEFYEFAKNYLKFDKDVEIKFLEDEENAKNPMGYTAYYDPEKYIISVFVTNRHPKDILRSVSHELIHHAQNCRGEDMNFGTQDIEENPKLYELEAEAGMMGNTIIPKIFQKHYMTEDKEKDKKEENDHLFKRNQKLNKILMDKFIKKEKKNG